MKDRVFLDTVGLVGVLNKDDEYHLQAIEVFATIGGEQRGVVTTDFVLGEVGNLLARTKLRDEVLWRVNELNQGDAAEVVYVEKELFVWGAKLYQERSDKAWGLVDCVSFSVMDRLGIVDAFTADHHFQQAGYNCLLK
jgi:uncharacterized protein